MHAFRESLRWANLPIALSAGAGLLLMLIAAVAYSRHPLAPEEARSLSAWAIPFALAGLLSAFAALIILLRRLLQGQWRQAAVLATAILVFLAGFAWAGAAAPGFLFTT